MKSPGFGIQEIVGRPNTLLKLDRESCEGCGGQVRVIACLDDPLAIAKILSPRQGVLELS